MLALSAPSVLAVIQPLPLTTLALIAGIGFFAAVIAKLILGVALLMYAESAQRKDSSLFIRSEGIRSLREPEPFDCRKKPSSSVMGKEGFATKKVDELHDAGVQERIKFVEGLADMDRYTVYNGRVL